MDNLNSPQPPQPIQPVIKNGQSPVNNPTKGNKKFLLFLFIFFAIDAVLILIYFVASGKININNLDINRAGKQTPKPSDIKKANEVKILSLAYIPLDDKNLDLTAIDNSNGNYSYLTPSDIKKNIDIMNDKLASDLEIGTKYHFYKDPKAQPAINYVFYNKIVKFETLPFTDNFYFGNPDIRLLDYNVILKDANICDLVDNKGVNEVWIWGYTSKYVKGWGSNMAGPYGDISNSDFDSADMPICKSTYTVYLYDYSKDVSDALLKHIRQFETLFTNLNKDLFWYKYVGYFSNSKWEGNWGKPQILDQKRRCGSDSFAPNSIDFNDLENTNSIPSDCANWDPNGGGVWQDINCNAWGCTPEGYYIFWMQNIPGPNNNLTYNGAKLRNWWDFISNFDEAMKVKQDLVY